VEEAAAAWRDGPDLFPGWICGNAMAYDGHMAYLSRRVIWLE
jgi:hypothetical protein